MTLKEIKRQIEAAFTEYEANKANADGSYNADAAGKLWDSLPRVFYKDLPAKLKKEADKFPIDRARRFLYECYPVGTLDAIAANTTAFNEKIVEALHASRYLVKSTDTTSSPVSLIGVDFIEAWERITGLTPIVIPNTAFNTIRQGTATNALTKIRAIAGDNTTADPFTKETTIQGRSGLALVLPALDQIGTPTTATWQLLDMITIEFTDNSSKSRDVQITLDKYMEKRELKDRKAARKQVTKDLELLRVSAINFTETRKKGEPQGYYKLNISSGAGISKSGVITFSFSDKFYNLLKGYPVMQYPSQLFELNNKRNPNSYYFLRKIAEHKNMNIEKKNEDIISVNTLLSASPYLPTYKKVMATDRHIDTRIINPFERDMDALSDTLNWEYCHSNGEPLSDEELSGFNYQLFKACLIRITWIDYPDQTARRKRIADAREKKRRNRGVKHRTKGGNAPQTGG
jgi:hypothetical protein